MGDPMSPTPSLLEIRTTYENFEGRCPHCGFWNVFNRVSDLKTVAPIAGLNVICGSAACGKPVRLIYDRIGPAFEMLLSESQEFWTAKRYMLCILTAVQAYEVFFAAVVRTWLLYRPLPNQRNLDIFNELSLQLYQKIRKYPFVHMRSMLFWLVLEDKQPKTLDEARAIIDALLPFPPGTHREDIVSRISGRLQGDLLRLFDTKAHEKRNLVIHMHAYRPSKMVAARVLVEARKTIYRLKHDLGPDLEFDDYMNAPPSPAPNNP